MHRQKHILTFTQPAVQSTWTRYEDKLFEKAFLDFPAGIAGRWQRIADAVPGRTMEQARFHYEELVHDIEVIESGKIETPFWADDDGRDSLMSWDSELKTSHFSIEIEKVSKHKEGERKKGTPWTEEEHRRFLAGMAKYGRGDWRSISRNSVVTRTPTQVASHAQKYFIRHNTVRKERKRSSIHDITTMNAAMQPSSSTDIHGDKRGPPPPPSQLGYECQ